MLIAVSCKTAPQSGDDALEAEFAAVTEEPETELFAEVIDIPVPSEIVESPDLEELDIIPRPDDPVYDWDEDYEDYDDDEAGEWLFEDYEDEESNEEWIEEDIDIIDEVLPVPDTDVLTPAPAVSPAEPAWPAVKKEEPAVPQGSGAAQPDPVIPPPAVNQPLETLQQENPQEKYFGTLPGDHRQTPQEEEFLRQRGNYPDPVFGSIMNYPSEPDQTLTYDKPGSTIEIELEAAGWIYAGERDNKSGIVLQSREFIDGNTVFKFRIIEDDNYKIVFQLQNDDGNQDLSQINIERQDTSLPQSFQPAAPQTAQPPVQQPPQVSQPQQSRPTQQAAQAPSSGTASSAPSAQQQQPTVAPQPVMPSSASSMMGQSQIIPEAQEVFPAASLQSEPADSQLLNQSPEDIIKTAQSLANVGNYAQAIDLLEKTLDTYQQFPLKEKLYYLLGKYYEADSLKRNPVKSVDYYTKLMEEFPLSNYVPEVENRIKYLHRHFIYIN